jgi:hypothetical protein
MIETYRWRGGTEMLLRHGAGLPITVLILPALFEEANRMRRFTISVMRNLAQSGISSILPDLPGTGESQIGICDIVLEDWHDAVSALIPGILGSVAIRGGALLDGPIKNRWRLSPESGERLLRDMVRATAFSESIAVNELDQRARIRPQRLAGNLISPGLYTALHDAVPDEGAHVTAIDGPKLWRAAEPGDDPEFASAIANDIAAWIKTCGA